MQRRQLLSSTGAGLVTVLGGCLSSESGTEENGENETDSQEPDGSEDNSEALEAASDDLDEAFDRMAEEADIAFELEPGNPINTSAIESSIENAEEALDEFDEAEADEEQLAAYESLRAVIEFAKAFFDVILEFESAFEAYDTAISYEENNRYNDAVSQLEIALEHFENAVDLLADANEAWEGVEGADSDTELDIADTKDELDELTEIADAYVLLTEAAIDFDTGYELYLEALDQYEQERYAESASTFAEATIEFGDAADQYRSGETEVSSSFRDAFINMTCYSEALLESSELFEDSADAAAGGDFQTAEDRAVEAEEALDAGCGGSA